MPRIQAPNPAEGKTADTERDAGGGRYEACATNPGRDARRPRGLAPPPPLRMRGTSSAAASPPGSPRCRRRVGPAAPGDLSADGSGSALPPLLSQQPSLRGCLALAATYLLSPPLRSFPARLKPDVLCGSRGWLGKSTRTRPLRHQPPGKLRPRPARSRFHWPLAALPPPHWLHAHKQLPLTSEASANCPVNQDCGHQPAP